MKTKTKGSLYVTGTEARCGKSVICLGIMELLLRSIPSDRIAFFRPLIKIDPEAGKDTDIQLIKECFDLDFEYDSSYAFTAEDADKMIAAGLYDELMDGIIERYRRVEENYDFILCEGTDLETSAFEFDINAEIAKNLGAPVLLVACAKDKTVDQVIASLEQAKGSIIEKGCQLISMIVNRVSLEQKDVLLKKIKKIQNKELIFLIPEVPFLGSPRMKDIMKHMDARLLYGEALLKRHVNSFVVAAMLLPNFLERIEDDCLIITPGDRSDVIVACLSVLTSASMPNISGIMLTGGLLPEPPIRKLIEGYKDMIPILSVKENTFPAAVKVNNIHPAISSDDTEKIELALDVFEESVDIKKLGELILRRRPDIVTPKRFEYNLMEWAKREPKTIVLPEGEDERIIRAAEIIKRKGIAKLIMLGDREKILQKAGIIGVDLDDIEIFIPSESKKIQEYAEVYYELRKHKRISFEFAYDLISNDRNFFGTMMVYMGDADGMVSGAVHTTADTIRPAFQIIKTKPAFSIVSSIFFMCLKDRVLVYGDCAVNPDPNAQELAEIAIASAQTAKQFGIEPRVAMISYSTGDSGKGKDVEKVRQATALAKKMAKDMGLDVEIDGPMQYDAAIDPEVAKIKMPESKVAGRATVFIFPDLDTGNTTYKAVQRSTGAIAIGPILQGLKKPVNDLSRGCTVKDIVNTVAITAIQAQEKQHEDTGN